MPTRYELIDWSSNSHPYSPPAIRHSLLLRLVIAGQHRIVRALPRREKIEFAEFLVEPDGFVEHPLLLVVVAHLDETGQRKILAQRMALEAIVGQEPGHVGIAGEDHAIRVVRLAVEPVV